MNKKEFEDSKYFKEVNSALKSCGIRVRMKSVKDCNQDYIIKWTHDIDNLHEAANEISIAKTIRDITINQIRNREREEFLKDICNE